MKAHHIQFRLIVAACGLITASLSFGDGYRNPPMTAEALGKSGNNLVFADDASAIEYNPANLAFQTNASVVVAVTLAHSDTTYNDGVTMRSVSPDDPWTPLPNLFISNPLGDTGVTLGLGISTPYGQGSEYGRMDLFAPPGRPAPVYEARMTLININPTVAFQVGDNLSVGVGVDFIDSTLEFKQYFPWPFPPPGDAEVDLQGYGVGGNVGVAWKMTDKQHLALTYRSGFKVDYHGDFKVSNFAGPPGTTPESDFSTEIEFPNIIGLGYGIELTDRIRIEADFEWQEWSSNKSLPLNAYNNQPLLFGQNEIINDWDDSIIIGVGGDWQFADNWVFRAGYRYLESPIPNATTTPILPDPDQHSIGIGLGFQAGAHGIDVAYVYSIYGDLEPTAAENPIYPGSYDIDSDLVGLTYSYTFQ
jgi:long-chain fatty acid transport protein